MDTAMPIHIEFSPEELIVLTEGLALPHIPGLEETRPARLKDRARELALDVARSDLVARGVLSPEIDEFIVADWLVDLLKVASRPALLCLALVESEGDVKSRFYMSTPEAAVEHRKELPEVHSLVPFSPQDTLERALEFVRLQTRPRPDVAGFDMPAGVLVKLGQAVQSHSAERIHRVVSESGVDLDAGLAFASALESKVLTAEVTTLHRPAEERLAGVDLVWLDGGDHGLWLTPTPERSPWKDDSAELREDANLTLIHIEPTSEEDIRSELLAGTPLVSSD